MAYTTISDLPEKLKADLVGTEYFLLSTTDTSYKTTLNTINDRLLELSGASYQELTNKVIDDVSNFVHANAIHISAKATTDIPKGTPVKIVNNADTAFVYVEIATDGQGVIGVCEDGLLAGELGEIMVAGVLTGYNTLGFTEGDLLYAGASVLTNVQPTNEYIKFIGYVLNRAENGKILISNSDPFPDAKQIAYDNTGTELTANNVQDAISEVNTKIATMEEIVFQQATAPTIAEGASDGDIWMDTTTNTLNVYREYPLGTNVYRWEPLLYKWDDTVDGGSW